MSAHDHTTHISLLLRIRDKSDSDAWSAFVRVYSPLVHRFGLRHGLQEADAADLVQAVMREVTVSIGHFDHNARKGAFRNWLYSLSRSALSRIRRTEKRQVAATGDSDVARQLDQEPDITAPPDAFWEREYERSLFEWAAGQVQDQVQPHTWQAFWLTAVEGRSAEDVSSEMGINLGSVYVAKNRILTRLKNKISEFENP